MSQNDQQQPDVIFPFLPKFSGGTPEKSKDGTPQESKDGFSYKGSVGYWHPDPELLSKFPADMIIGSDEDRIESNVLTSIPDVWARMYFFAQALTSKGSHPGRKAVIEEWRGLLGAICFGETYGPLTTETITLPNPETKTKEKKHPPIADALNTMIPDKRTFRTIHLIKINNVLIGATSPYSIVFTPPSYKAPDVIPWRRSDGRLTDPTEYLSGKKGTFARQLGLLRTWLEGSVHGIVPDLSLPSPIEQRLQALIKDDWADKIEQAPVKIEGEHPSPVMIVVPDVMLYPLPKVGLGDGEIVSDVQIDLAALRLEFKTPKEGSPKEDSPIVYWEEGWNQNRRVYMAYDSKVVPAPDGKTGDSLLGGKIRHSWIDPLKFFFTEVIVRVQLERGSVLCENGENYLLPLRSEILKYFDAAFLQSHFKLRVAPPDETVTAELRIPLSGGGEAVIRKPYAPDHQSTVFQRDAVILWPNMKLADWQHYYLFARLPVKGAGEWSCEPIGASRLDGSEFDEPDVTPPQRCKIWRLAGPPDAVAFHQAQGPVGLCLPMWEKSPDQYRNARWRVAVDFGTTNTSAAYLNLGDKDDAHSLDFKAHHRILLSVPEGPAMVSVASRYFLPLDEKLQKSPFPSVYYGLVQVPIPSAILHGTVPFELPALQYGAGNFDGYRTRLKWEQDPVAIKKVNGFLAQVVMLAFLEARCADVGEIHFHWTYPSAFDRKRRLQFDGVWRATARGLAAATGFGNRTSPDSSTDAEDQAGEESAPKSEISAEEEKITSGLFLRKARKDDGDPTITESIAVCQYAKHHHGITPLGEYHAQVTLDIGGGTTDLGIWWDRRIRAQSSLLLAADVVAEYIHGSNDFASLLLDWAKLGQGRFGLTWRNAFNSNKNYAAAVNAYYRHHDQDRMVSSTIAKDAKVTPAVRRAVSLAACAIGGVTYYAGMMLRASLPAKVKLSGADIVFAGNGSRLLLWLGEREFYEPFVSAFLLKGFGHELSGQAPEARSVPAKPEAVQVKVIRSKQPKLETAMGILLEMVREKDAPAPSVFVGEEGVSIGGEIKDRFFDLCQIPIGDKTRWASVKVGGDLPVLREFVSLYNHWADEYGLDEIAADINYAKIQDHMRQSLYEFEANPEETSLSSPFAVEVKKILESLMGRRI